MEKHPALLKDNGSGSHLGRLEASCCKCLEGLLVLTYFLHGHTEWHTPPWLPVIGRVPGRWMNQEE